MVPNMALFSSLIRVGPFKPLQIRSGSDGMAITGPDLQLGKPGVAPILAGKNFHSGSGPAEEAIEKKRICLGEILRCHLVFKKIIKIFFTYLSTSRIMYTKPILIYLFFFNEVNKMTFHFVLTR